jgi:hypothetical protein
MERTRRSRSVLLDAKPFVLMCVTIPDVCKGVDGRKFGSGVRTIESDPNSPPPTGSEWPSWVGFQPFSRNKPTARVRRFRPFKRWRPNHRSLPFADIRPYA